MAWGQARGLRAQFPRSPRPPEPSPRSSAPGGAGRGDSRRPARPALRSRKRRGSGPESQPRGRPSSQLTLKSLPLRSTPRTNGSTPVASMVAQLSTGKEDAGRPGAAGWVSAGPAPLTRARLLPAAASAGSAARRLPELQACRGQSSGTGEGCRGPAGDDHHFQSPVATWRMGSRHCRLGYCSLWSCPDPGEIVVPTSVTVCEASMVVVVVRLPGLWGPALQLLDCFAHV